jgi:hypothetical protein
MNKKHFQHSLNLWKQSEIDFIKSIWNRFAKMYLAPYQNFSFYDIIWIMEDWEIKTFEVKWAKNAYNNIFIEAKSNWKLSWITITKADYYVFELKDWFYFAETERIKDIIRFCKYKNNAGYNWLSEWYLMPINLFKEIFKKYND